MTIEILCLYEGVDLVQVAVFTVSRHWRPSWDDLIQNQAVILETSVLMFSSNNSKLSHKWCPSTFLN